MGQVVNCTSRYQYSLCVLFRSRFCGFERPIRLRLVVLVLRRWNERDIIHARSHTSRPTLRVLQIIALHFTPTTIADTTRATLRVVSRLIGHASTVAPAGESSFREMKQRPQGWDGRAGEEDRALCDAEDIKVGDWVCGIWLD